MALRAEIALATGRLYYTDLSVSFQTDHPYYTDLSENMFGSNVMLSQNTIALYWQFVHTY